MFPRLRVLPAAMAAAAVLALAACGEDDAGDTSTAGSTAGGAAMAQVELADSSFGQILVDGEGRTLYLFTNDSPGQSVCEGDCLANWPALEGEVEAGDGVDADLLGTIERSDGTVQATYNDWPLYYFAADQAPGDTAGQGVNDVWFVVNAEGEAVTEAAAGASSGGDSGYSY